MRMTPHSGAVPDEETFAVLKAALAAGVNVWGGADFYGTSERSSLHLLARYFTQYPEDADKVVICIKSGIVDMRTLNMDGSPDGIRRMLANANSTLGGRKKIDVFGIARVDPKTPIEESVRALAELKAAGEIGGILLSEVGANTIRRAASVAQIDMVEQEVSLWATGIFENGVATTCGELGIPIVAHTPIGAGMLTGRIKSIDDLPHGSYLRMFPRFQPENFQKNLALVSEIEKLAKAKGVSPAQLALSWLKLQSKKPGMPLIIPIAGASSEARVKENAAIIDLSDDDLKAITGTLESFPVAGDRYPAAAMKLVGV
ncbi:putative aldo/keto reductase [Hypoxylon trugodes]|uniref:putative aldo/keto reductase n=1 Tax=Hypoxylon trugodes TaxID=326681 RepID=UPI00218E5E3D|nr:putative aldo/keto reductase [Hypoxylon trugodes]KAI1388991.1 putative aldo/keto reductase [Hypoxylon trugodes]